MIWKYSRKRKQDESANKGQRYEYTIGRHRNGPHLFRLIKWTWTDRASRDIFYHTIGYFARVKDAKQLAELFENLGGRIPPKDTVDKRAIKRHLEAALDELNKETP